MAKAYTHPEVLVSTDWVDQHKADDNVRIVEVDMSITAYREQGHIPGAVGWNWEERFATTSAATFSRSRTSRN